METAEEMPAAARRPLLTYERLVPGLELGRATLRANAETLATWHVLFPSVVDEAESVPPGLLAVLMMKAFGAEVASRLPGYAVAGHSLRWSARPVRCGEGLAVTFHCLWKEIRPDGPRIDVEAVMHTEAGDLVFEGEVSLVRAVAE